MAFLLFLKTFPVNLERRQSAPTGHEQDATSGQKASHMETNRTLMNTNMTPMNTNMMRMNTNMTPIDTNLTPLDINKMSMASCLCPGGAILE